MNSSRAAAAMPLAMADVAVKVLSCFAMLNLLLLMVRTKRLIAARNGAFARARRESNARNRSTRTVMRSARCPGYYFV
jgi:hypothetical protein